MAELLVRDPDTGEWLTIAGSSSNHAAVILGNGSDPALHLSGQQLFLDDVLTPSEHAAIGGFASPHHAAITLDGSNYNALSLNGQALKLEQTILDARYAPLSLSHSPVTVADGAGVLSINGQALTLAAVLTPGAHTAIGNASPHHAPITLGDGCDAALSLTGQVLTLNQATLDARYSGIGRLIIAGAGLTGGGNLGSDVTLNVGAGEGVTVNADSVALTWGTPTIGTISAGDTANAGAGTNPARSDHRHAIAMAAPGANSVNISTSVEGNAATFARSNHTHQLDQSIVPTWTGVHTFQAGITARNIQPQTTDTYDLGSPTNIWRKAYISTLTSFLLEEDTVSLIGGFLMISKDEGTLPGDVSNTDTTINFGKTMTPGDFVLLRIPSITEHISVGTLVSGTTYNVTRDLASVGAANWQAGSVFAVLGHTGNGRIELNAYDTPRISVIKQGATYNAQTEGVRLGDLNGLADYGSETYGAFIGDYAADKWLAYDATEGLRVHGNAIIEGTITAAGLDVDELSAISANLGAVTSGSLLSSSILGCSVALTKAAGVLPANVGSGDTTVNFGMTMTLGDFVNFVTEYMKVGSLVSGTTYNVTRNLSGGGLQNFVSKTPFTVIGQTGNGRIEMSTGDPLRLSVFRQGLDAPGKPTLFLIQGPDSNINPGTYYYVITALSAIGETVKGTQSDVLVVGSNAMQIQVSWTAVPGATGYRVYRTTSSGTYATPALIVQTTATTILDSLTTPSSGQPPATDTANGYATAFEMVRIGDLNGLADYSSSTYGILVGDFADSRYLSYDLVNGLRIAGDAVFGNIVGATFTSMNWEGKVGLQIINGGMTISDLGSITFVDSSYVAPPMWPPWAGGGGTTGHINFLPGQLTIGLSIGDSPWAASIAFQGLGMYISTIGMWDTYPARALLDINTEGYAVPIALDPHNLDVALAGGLEWDGTNLYICQVSGPDCVLGTNGASYYCAVPHTSLASVNRPITGTSYNRWWRWSNVPTINEWQDGHTYTSGVRKTLLYNDATNIASSFDMVGLDITRTCSQVTYSTTSTRGAQFRLMKSHQNTAGNAATVDTEMLGMIAWLGNSGSAFSNAASIQANQEGTAGTSYTPAALVFSTSDGTANRVERMRINKSGYIGVGTSVPGAMLHLYSITGSVTVRNEMILDSGSPWFDNMRARSGPAIVQDGDTCGGMTFKGWDGGAYRNVGYIAGQVDGTPGASDMPGRIVFYTVPDGSITAAERMRINNNGKVGIGTTTNTTYPLEVYGSIRVSNGSGGGVVYADGTTQTTAAATSTGYTSTTDLNFAADSDANGSGTMSFATSGTNRMVILPTTGYIGIGTASPISELQMVKAGSTAWQTIYLDNFCATTAGNSSNIRFRKSHSDSAAYGATGANEALGYLYFYGASASAFINGAYFGARQEGANGTYSPTQFQWATSDGSNNWAIRMVLSSAGYLGIGPFAYNVLPATVLHLCLPVAGSSYITHEGYSDTVTTSPRINFRRGGGTVSAPTPVKSGMELASIGTNAYITTHAGTGGTWDGYKPFIRATAGEDFWSDATIGGGYYVQFFSRPIGDVSMGGNVERMRISEAGYVGIGNTAPTGKFTVTMSGSSTPAEADRSIYQEVYSDGVSYMASHSFRKSHSNTINANVATVDTDGIGVIAWWGNSGSTFSHAALIGVYQEGAAGTYTPANMRFYTSDGTTNWAERIRISSAGLVGIGTTAPNAKLSVSLNTAALPAVTTPTGTIVQFGNADGSATRLILDVFASNASLTFRRCDNTAASPTALAANDAIGNIASMGYYGGATPAYCTASRASISFYASEAWTDVAQGTHIIISTTQIGTVTVVEKLRIGDNGDITMSRGSGSQVAIKSLTELVTINAAAYSDTSIMIPAGCIILAVDVRVTVVIPTASTFNVGVPGATTMFATGVSTAANSTNKGTISPALATYVPVRLTPNVTPANNSGRVRVTIHYIDITPATS